MATLTKCILCGAQLVNGREWDGEDHVCEADRTPEVTESDLDDARRQARGEYLGELDEAREDEEP